MAEAATVLTPVQIETGRVSVRVDCFDAPIDLRFLRQQLQAIEGLQPEPLVVRPASGSYFVVMGFGAVSFWKSRWPFTIFS